MVNSDNAKLRLLDAAGPEFAAKGFEGATVREICLRAEVNVAAVNYYFGDKERLYVAAVKRARALREEQVPMPLWAETLPAEQKLRQFITILLSRMMGVQAASWQTRLMMREIQHPTTACRELVRDYMRPDFDLLLGILEELVPAETPRYRREQIGFSIVGQCFFYLAADNVVSLLIPAEELATHYQIDQLAEHIQQVSLAALGAAPPLDGMLLSPPTARPTNSWNPS